MNDRNNDLVKKFKNGATQTSLALEKKITRARVSAILVSIMGYNAVKEQAKINLKNKHAKEAEKNKGFKYICQNKKCGKVFYDKYLKRKFCSPECFDEHRRDNSFTEEEKKQRTKERMRAYYLKRKKV